MSLADVKALARQPLHDFMSRAAVLHSPTETVVGNITARLHDMSKKVGDLAGTNLSYAEQMERPTTLVLWLAQITDLGYTLKRNCSVVFGPTEGYRISVVHPADNQTVTVDVTPLSATDLAGKTLPDGTTIPV
jgi:hypothetical protein